LPILAIAVVATRRNVMLSLERLNWIREIKHQS
jgi:hypothetical protein